ncbi:hypothetical protein JZK55_11760 [Dissulfurispira thermophila]|uniref:DUF3108 domain-containing protein n=1 Tax=Dissulfurispira thermophila TaxID=2715679 RepID=A0A7G1H0K2_9BACT|nr:DUF3108 domain-containing protein [Dissulfurispira thermophila]BCB96254.1 hypothetical protein JZK55_11760 [Dissulfurispira thermophila]
MGIIKKGTLSLIIAIILSIMLHIIVIASISGIDLFNFGELFTTKPFEAKIVSELPKKTNLIKSSKKQPSIQPDIIPQVDDKGQEIEDKQLHEDSFKENTIKTEQIQENTSMDNGQIHDNKNESQRIAALPEREKPVELPESKNTIPILKFAKEKLYFDIYWLGIYVGKAFLEATNDNGNIKIISSVHSTPFISTFYKVDDHAESYVINGTPSFFKIKQREGRKRGDKETFFDITNKKIIHINHIKGTRDEHIINTEHLWDVMSGFYYLRTQKLNVGETIHINIFDSNKFYKAEIEVLRKDKVIMPDEKEVDAVVVKPMLKSEGLFENKGDIYVWLSDDDLKIPLKVETEVSIGNVIAKLKAIETEIETETEK